MVQRQVVKALCVVLATVALCVVLCGASDSASGQISLRSGPVVWTFGTKAGLSLVSLQYDDGRMKQTIVDHPDGRPLFELSVNGVLPAGAKMNAKGGYDWQPGCGKIAPASLNVADARRIQVDGKDAVEFRIVADTLSGPFEGTVRAVTSEPGEVRFSVELTCRSKDHYVKTTLRGPILEEASLGNDDWYFFPRSRGTLSDSPCRLATYYGQYAWMQCMGVWGKDTGLVLSTVVIEDEAQPKSFVLQKAPKGGEKRVEQLPYSAPFCEDLLNAKGVTQTLEFIDWTPEIGATASYGQVAVAVGKGDWRDVYHRYQRYKASWWQPKTRTWIRHHYIREGEHPYCAESLQEHIDYPLPFQDHVEFIIAKPMSLSNYLDYSLVQPHDTESIARMVKGWHQKGVRGTVYVHGKGIAPTDDFAKEHAYDLTLDTPPPGEDKGGPPGTGATDGLHWVNLHEPLWRQWLGDVSADILRKTGADGIRLDCIGFTMFGGGNGTNPRVKTPPTRHDWMVNASVDTVAYIRAAMDKVNPAATLGAENLGTDRMMNVLDYSICYNVWDAFFSPKDCYPSPVVYTRFVFPDFKFLEFILVPDPAETPIAYPIPIEDIVKFGRFTDKDDMVEELLHEILFNGAGFAHWARTPSLLPTLEMMQRVLRQNTHCFEGADLTPEIPTLKEGVYANRFAATTDPGSPRAVTLMNWTRSRVEGPLVELSLSDGEKVVEMVGMRRVDVVDGKAGLAIDPMRAAVLRVVPGKIKLTKRCGKDWAFRAWRDTALAEVPTDLAADQKLIAYVLKPDGGCVPANIRMLNGRSAIVYDVHPQDRVAVQLMHLLTSDSIEQLYVLDDVSVAE